MCTARRVLFIGLQLALAAGCAATGSPTPTQTAAPASHVVATKHGTRPPLRRTSSRTTPTTMAPTTTTTSMPTTTSPRPRVPACDATNAEKNKPNVAMDLYPERRNRSPKNDFEVPAGQCVRISGMSAFVLSADMQDSDNEVLIVHVRMVSRTSENGLSDRDWYLTTATGHRIDPSPSFRIDSLTGEVLKGHPTDRGVLFKAKPGRWYVNFKPDPFNDSRGVWRIEVPPSTTPPPPRVVELPPPATPAPPTEPSSSEEPPAPTPTVPPASAPPATAPPVTAPPLPPPPTAPSSDGTYYASCSDAKAHGATNIRRGQPGYRPELDRDNDGVACES